MLDSFIPSQVGGAQHGADRHAADPMSRALIGNGEAPPSGTSGSPLRIAAKCNRSSTGDDDHAGTSAKGRRQSDLHVTHHFNFPGNYFRNDVAYDVRYFRAPGTRSANARTEHLVRIHSCGAARLAYRLLESFTGAGLANASDVAAAHRNRGEKGGFVADSARRLAAAAVNAQIVGHALVLSQGKIELAFTATSIKTHSRGVRIAAII